MQTATAPSGETEHHFGLPQMGQGLLLVILCQLLSIDISELLTTNWSIKTILLYLELLTLGSYKLEDIH
jgi:hypothetical protein